MIVAEVAIEADLTLIMVNKRVIKNFWPCIYCTSEYMGGGVTAPRLPQSLWACTLYIKLVKCMALWGEPERYCITFTQNQTLRKCLVLMLQSENLERMCRVAQFRVYSTTPPNLYIVWMHVQVRRRHLSHQLVILWTPMPLMVQPCWRQRQLTTTLHTCTGNFNTCDRMCAKPLPFAPCPIASLSSCLITYSLLHRVALNCCSIASLSLNRLVSYLVHHAEQDSTATA